MTAIVVYAATSMADLVLQYRDAKRVAALRWQSVMIASVAFAVSIFAVVGSGLEVAGYTLLLLIAGLPIYFWLKNR